MISIKPITLSAFPALVTADRAQVLQIEVIPGVQASGTLAFGTEDADGNFVALQSGMTVAITPEQYANWGTDDTYAINTLLANAGVERA
jgi:hypothetical protein